MALVEVNHRKVVVEEELECWLVLGFDRLRFERLERMSRLQEDQQQERRRRLSQLPYEHWQWQRQQEQR